MIEIDRDLRTALHNDEVKQGTGKNDPFSARERSGSL
jgi:hypothetical protein